MLRRGMLFSLVMGAVLSSQFAAAEISNLKDVVAGSYLVARLAIEGPYFVIEAKVSEDGSNFEYRDANLEDQTQAPCAGQLIYPTKKSQEKSIVEMVVKCDGDEESYVTQIDMSAVNSVEDLESAEGVRVMAKSDFIDSNQWIPFTLRKQSTPFFR